MSVRRLLVGCDVLSLQDGCLFYPCCKGCFSRLDAEQRDSRYSCSRCGCWCLREQVDYRYRLSLLVARDAATFCVTVFGNSLNSFFGIHATGLQRLVERSEGPMGPSARSALLLQAVEDCLLGRHFIFGIKLSGTEREPWLKDPDGNQSSSRERTQFVASQMILPTASGPTGCTVLRYYQRLLQKVCESAAESAHPSQTFKPFAAPLLLTSPNSTFDDITLHHSSLLSQALLGFQPTDHAFPSTPPWQQSLGLVTSSAEQDEKSSQDGGDRDSRLTGASVSLDDHPGTKERTAPLQLGRSFHTTPFSTGMPNSSYRENSFSQSQPRYKSRSLTQKDFPTTLQTKTPISSSLNWNDLPFSESLTEYLCKENKDFPVKTTSFNLQHQKPTAATIEENGTLSDEPAYARQSAAEINGRDKLQDITNTPEGDQEYVLSDQDRFNCDEHVSRLEGGEISWDSEAFFSPGKQEQHSEADGYNCSADLFGDSLVIETHTNAGARPSPSDAAFHCTELNDQHLKNESFAGLRSTPHKQKLKTKLFKRDSLGLQDLDFLPPTQSTPCMKLCAATQSHTVTSYRYLNNESLRENTMRSMRSSRCKTKITSGRRSRKSEKQKDKHPVGRHVKLQIQRLNFESPRTSSQRHDSKTSCVTGGDYNNGEGIVPPTPAHKMQLNVEFRERQQMENGRRDSCWNRNSSGSDRCDHSRPHWDQTQTVFYANESVGERYLDGSQDQPSEDVNNTCDWSRDLFSDSI
ncbi:DNA damage-induced apoptosis suppressor protein [Cyprinodon tularosa]|uniref:DNA damage-induced apoptosis suppressor protein n=1 Tax=Cyprinodon tularosa TaxID=77115 RepID=UPI0018E1FD2D|nr:DNA damage-induced apoptosis suppressor protein [Cyprinodon tularosa]